MNYFTFLLVDENVFDMTKNWFETQQVPYDHIELIGSHDKIAVAKKHKVDAFFEDKHDNAVMIAEGTKHSGVFI